MFGKNIQIEKVVEVKHMNPAQKFLKKVSRTFNAKDF
jgi:hypothetical protein